MKALHLEKYLESFHLTTMKLFRKLFMDGDFPGDGPQEDLAVTHFTRMFAYRLYPIVIGSAVVLALKLFLV
jgi:hypothetical protein